MTDEHPNNLNIATFLEEIWAHQIAHPTHGYDCSCMDEYIRRLRKATRMTQAFIDLYMQDEDGEKNVQAMENRTQYVFRVALESRRPYRRTDQCYCCSCTDDNYLDPYCRSHGFAGERPCSLHHSPGGVDEDKWPLSSVQEKRASYGTHS
jgi:hypothetical protein